MAAVSKPGDDGAAAVQKGEEPLERVSLRGQLVDQVVGMAPSLPEGDADDEAQAPDGPGAPLPRLDSLCSGMRASGDPWFFGRGDADGRMSFAPVSVPSRSAVDPGFACGSLDA